MRRIARLSLIVVAAISAAPALLAEIDVEISPESVYVGEPTTLKIRMTGSDITKIDRSMVTAEGLVFLGGPSVRSEYRWVNGRTTRSRVVEFVFSASSPGTASVRVAFAPPRGSARVITRTVRVSGSSTSGLRLPGRGPWIVAEVSRESIYEGEQVIATWYVISETTGRSVMQQLPELAGFFVEELSVEDEGMEPISVRGRNMLKWPIKRYALVPLSNGVQELGSLEALVPTRRVSSWLEGLRSSLDTTAAARSLPLSIEVLPRPEGARLIGSFSMECSTRPRMERDGPIRIDAVVSGSGNLRSAPPPSFEKDPGVIARPISNPSEYRRQGDGVEMRKEWSWLIFPSEVGQLSVPGLRFGYFDPKSHENRVLRCGGWLVNVENLPVQVAESMPAGTGGDVASEAERAEPGASRPGSSAVTTSAVFTIAALGLMAFWFRRKNLKRSEVRKLVEIAGNEPLLRQRIETLAIRKGWSPRELDQDRSEAGDAWRAVFSSLDLRKREPWAEDVHTATLHERLRELVESL